MLVGRGAVFMPRRGWLAAGHGRGRAKDGADHAKACAWRPQEKNFPASTSCLRPRLYGIINQAN
jgi:hypothetical protein